jgi:hypothetical protein
LTGGGKALGPPDVILFIDDGGDVQILVRIHATDDVMPAFFNDIHSQSPSWTVTNGFAETECADRTVTRP